MSKNGNLSLIQVAHCQFPLNKWKLFFASTILLHLTWTLELQLKQGIPGLERDKATVQTEQQRDICDANTDRFSRENLSELHESLSKVLWSTLWNGKTVGRHDLHNQ